MRERDGEITKSKDGFRMFSFVNRTRDKASTVSLSLSLVGVETTMRTRLECPLRLFRSGIEPLPNDLSIVKSSFSKKAKMHSCDLLDIIS